MRNRIPWKRFFKTGPRTACSALVVLVAFSLTGTVLSWAEPSRTARKEAPHTGAVLHVLPAPLSEKSVLKGPH